MQNTGDPSLSSSPNLHQYPKTVTAAGIVWIIIGAGILANLPVFLLPKLNLIAIANPGNRAVVVLGVVVGGLFQGVLGGFFLHEGISSCRGTIPSTVGIAVGSFLCALIFLGLCALPPRT